MKTQTIHIRELIGRCVAEVYCSPPEVTARDDSRDPPVRCYERSRGFVKFEGGLVVELDQSMNVQPMTEAQLPPGCAPVRPADEMAIDTEPYPTWAGTAVVDVGCST